MTRSSRGLRAAAASAALVAGLTGLSACSDSAGPESGEVTTEDLQSVEDDLAALEERVAGVEDAGAGGGNVAEGDMGLFEQAQDLVGQQVTVSAGVSEVITSGSTGAAFKIAGDEGDPIAVISANQPDALQVDDTVQVMGTVKEIQRDTFEEDFGVAAEDLYDDVDAFFEEEEGQVAVAAQRIQVLQEQAQG